MPPKSIENGEGVAPSPNLSQGFVDGLSRLARDGFFFITHENVGLSMILDGEKRDHISR
ncbi:MAG: hypothetical protein IKJ65_00215 [Clostridia bacterium]|nr:hypothetical protein [Clostridia bacterium]